jgi:hypothetical protein
VDLRAGRIATDNEHLILERSPMDLILGGKGVPHRYGDKNTRLPENSGVAVRCRGRPGDKSDIELAFGDPGDVFIGRAIDEVDSNGRM